MEIDLTLVRQILMKPMAPLPEELVEMYAHFGLPSTGSYTRSAVSEHLTTQMSARLGPGASATKWALKKQLIYEHVLDGVAVEPFLSILNTIPDGQATGASDWRTVLALARNARGLSAGHPSESFEQANVRHLNVARAALALRNRGFDVEAKAGVIVFSDIGTVGAEIQRLAHQLDGPSLVLSMVGRLERAFDPELNRYTITRPLPYVPKERLPSIPHGYLLNCAIRDSESPGIGLDSDEQAAAFEQYVSLARELTATMDVEAYSMFERMMFDPTNVLDIMRRIVAFDTCFAFPQLAPKHMLEIIDNIFCEFTDEECVQAWGGTQPEMRGLCAAVFERTPKTGPVALSIPAIVATAGLSPTKGNAILKRLTHPRGTVNAGFLLPFDVKSFHDRPLIEMGGAEALLVDPYLCAPGFYEGLTQALRGAGVEGVDRRIGPGVEQVVYEAFRRRNISFQHGKYLEFGTTSEPECDCVVETDREVFIIEIKKRPLGPEARIGNDLKLLRDLAAGLVKAQVQALRHEVHLRRKGTLDLPTGTVSLKGREVERVAITLTEYGTLHDRESARNFLRAILAANFSASQPLDSDLDELRGLQAKLRTGITELQKLGVVHPDWFMPVLFVSVPQLLTILDDVSSNEELGSALRATRNVTNGAGDLLGDYKYVRGLKRSRP